MGMIGNSLAQGLISGANIQDGTVDTPDIKDSAVTAAKIASGVVTPAKMDFTGGTANGLLYLNGSKVASSGSGLVFDGTNLGIGTSSPSGRVSTAVADGSTNAFYAERTGASPATLAVTFANAYSNILSSGVMTFSTAATERMRIDSSGNVGFGVSTVAGAGKIQLGATEIIGFQGAAGGNIASNLYYASGWKYLTTGTATMYSQSNGGHYWYCVGSGSVNTTATFSQSMWLDPNGHLNLASGKNLYLENTNQFIRGGGGTQVIVGAASGGFYQQVGGSYYLVTTSGGSTSDASLKTNVQQLTGALEKVCAIRGVSFEFIEEQMCTADQGTQLGVIAQEVEAQFPEIVLTNEDGIKTVRYDRLVAPLIEAVKEQQAIIEALTTRITALETP